MVASAPRPRPLFASMGGHLVFPSIVTAAPSFRLSMLDFRSHHPLQHKVSVVRTLVSRADRLCSSVASGSVELAHISKALMTNGYPTSFISRHSTLPTRPRHRPPPPPPTPGASSSSSPVVVLPDVEGVSEAIKWVLSPLGVTTRFWPLLSLRQLLSRPKDRVDNLERPGVVYRVPCASCQCCYIGQTGRSLSCRLKEHKSVVRNRDVASSALAEHWLDTGHIRSPGMRPLLWSRAVIGAFADPWRLGTFDLARPP